MNSTQLKTTKAPKDSTTQVGGPEQPVRHSIAKAVGKRVKLLRIEAEMSQEDLAFEANLGRAAVSAIESGRGNPTVLTLATLARVLNVSLAELFAPLTMKVDEIDERRANAPATKRLR